LAVHLAVLADVHGNLPALEAVLDDAQQYRVDGVIVAGDLTGGPEDVKVIQRLRSLGSWAIRGNREEYLLEYRSQGGRHWAFLRSLHRRLSDQARDYIASLPTQRVVSADGTEPIRVVHGSPYSSREMLIPEDDADTLQVFEQAGLLPTDQNPARAASSAGEEIDENVLVCGHTHIPWAQEHAGKLIFNPGAVGMPINGDSRAQYAILTWQSRRWRVEHRAVPYAIERTRAAFRESRLLEDGGGFARAGFLAIETGQNVPGRFIKHARSAATQAGFARDAVLPDAVWEQIEATFDWEGARSGLCTDKEMQLWSH
jgi:putative phosphoesterase